MFAPVIAKVQAKAASSPTSKPLTQSSTLLARPGTVGQEAELAPPGSQATEPGVSWDFSKVPASASERPNQSRALPQGAASSPPAAVIQPKLAMGTPGDRFEQEADAMAAYVVQRISSGPALSQRPPAVQAKSDATQGELPRQPDADEQSSALQHSIEAARGSGHSMDHSTQHQMESSFGADFSGVRIHTDERADGLSRSISARAFTTGRDVFFRQGEYNPGTSSGHELLAHELTHVVQQNGAGVQTRSPANDQDHPLESEARQAAKAVTQHDQVNVGSAGGAAAGGARMGAPIGVPAVGVNSTIQRDTIQRDETPPKAADVPAKTADVPPKAADVPPKAADAPPKADAPPAAGAADKTPTAQPGAADQVALDWWIDWQNKETGEPVSSKSNARTGKDAASGKLKVLPAAGAGSAGVYDWVNAASSGAVRVGTMKQAKDKGGQVSTDISWQDKRPSALAAVKVNETADDKKNVGKSQLPQKQKAANEAAAAALDKALETEGGLDLLKTDVQKAAQDAVGPGGNGYSYSVSVDLKLDRGGSKNSRAAGPVPYDAASKDDRRTVTVVVPTEVQKLKGSGSVQQENWSNQNTADKSFKRDDSSDEKLDSKTTSLINDVTTSFESMFNSSFDNWKKQRSTSSLGGSFHVDGSVGGSTGLSGEVSDLTIDLGTLLSLVLVENPLLAFAVKKALGTAKIGGKGSVDLDAEIKGQVGAHAQWTKEDLDQTLTKIDSHVKNTIATHVRSEVQKTVTHKTSKSQTTVEAKDQSKEEGSRKKSSSSSETVGVKYIIGEPQLQVRNG